MHFLLQYTNLFVMKTEESQNNSDFSSNDKKDHMAQSIFVAHRISGHFQPIGNNFASGRLLPAPWNLPVSVSPIFQHVRTPKLKCPVFPGRKKLDEKMKKSIMCLCSSLWFLHYPALKQWPWTPDSIMKQCSSVLCSGQRLFCQLESPQS